MRIFVKAKRPKTSLGQFIVIIIGTILFFICFEYAIGKLINSKFKNRTNNEHLEIK